MEIEIKPFAKVLYDSTRKFKKIPKRDYLEKGSYPIIDQSKDFIAGYTNNESLVNKEDLPVIIFGDHTRALKFIDYPIALGADGVKALTIKSKDYFSRYLYYALKNIKLPDAGYSRHFKFLKESNLPIPKKLDDQKRIAQVLYDCEELIAKRKQSITILDELVKSTFLEMFGDPVRNEMGWEISTIGEKFNVKGGKRVPKGYKLVDENTGLPYIKAGNIKNGTITNKAIQYLTEDVQKTIARYIVEKGDVVMTVVGVNIGDVGVIPVKFDKANLTENANKFIAKKDTKIESSFLAHYLMSDFVQRQVLGKIRAAGVPKLAIFRIEQIPLPLPDEKFQSKFSKAIRLIKATKKLYQSHLTELENLYGRLSQDAFKGDLELSKVKLRKEIE